MQIQFGSFQLSGVDSTGNIHRKLDTSGVKTPLFGADSFSRRKGGSETGGNFREGGSETGGNEK
jgi:hypothetical protein